MDQAYEVMLYKLMGYGMAYLIEREQKSPTSFRQQAYEEGRKLFKKSLESKLTLRGREAS